MSEADVVVHIVSGPSQDPLSPLLVMRRRAIALCVQRHRLPAERIPCVECQRQVAGL